MVASPNKKAYNDSAETPCAHDYSLMLKNPHVPAMFVTCDFITPPEAAGFMQRKTPNATLAVVRGEGRLPNGVLPSEFHKVLLEFLKGAA